MKTVLVTGSNRGIGFEVARQLGKMGWRVIVTSRFYTRAEAAWKALQQEGIEGLFVQLDVTDSISINEAFKRLQQEVEFIDVLINNAGIAVDNGHSILEIPLAKVYFTMQTNAVGALDVTRRLLPIIRSGGRIINVSSGMGAVEQGISLGSPVYSASKTLLNLFTRQLAHALKDNHISINAVCPGWVKTSMGGDAAPRSVEKGAETVVWLASEAPAELSGKFFRDKTEIPW